MKEFEKLLDSVYELEGLLHLAVARDLPPATLTSLIKRKGREIVAAIGTLPDDIPAEDSPVEDSPVEDNHVDKNILDILQEEVSLTREDISVEREEINQGESDDVTISEVKVEEEMFDITVRICLLSTSPSQRDKARARMPSSD